MARRLSVPLKASGSKPRHFSYDLQSQKRFYIVLGVALFLHLLLLGMLKLQPEKLSLKKKATSWFEMATQVQTVKVSINFSGAASSETPAQQHFPLATSLATQEKKLPPAAPTLSPSSASPTTASARKRTVSAASHQSQDADYLARWQTYVEEFGNAHYPTVALKNNLRGELRLLVGIRRDGSINEVSLRKSSGSPILDEAAINLVKAAGPFEPLPADLSQEIEVLEIIRTWQFRGRLHTTG